MEGLEQKKETNRFQIPSLAIDILFLGRIGLKVENNFFGRFPFNP
jgi:hypothetical protein